MTDNKLCTDAHCREIVAILEDHYNKCQQRARETWWYQFSARDFWRSRAEDYEVALRRIHFAHHMKRLYDEQKKRAG